MVKRRIALGEEGRKDSLGFIVSAESGAGGLSNQPGLIFGRAPPLMAVGRNAVAVVRAGRLSSAVPPRRQRTAVSRDRRGHSAPRHGGRRAAPRRRSSAGASESCLSVPWPFPCLPVP